MLVLKIWLAKGGLDTIKEMAFTSNNLKWKALIKDLEALRDFPFSIWQLLHVLSEQRAWNGNFDSVERLWGQFAPQKQNSARAVFKKTAKKRNRVKNMFRYFIKLRLHHNCSEYTL